MNAYHFKSLIMALCISSLNAYAQAARADCLAPWGLSPMVNGTNVWLLSLPSLGASQGQICKMEFSPGYITRVVCYNNSASGIGAMTDNASLTLSNPVGWPTSLSSDCQITSKVPLRKAGGVSINATIAGNSISGTYYSSKHPEGVAFDGARIVPIIQR